MSEKCKKIMDLPSDKCVICNKTIEEIGGERITDKVIFKMILPDAVKIKMEEEKLKNKTPWFCQKCGHSTCDECGAPKFRAHGCNVIHDDGSIALNPIPRFINFGCINTKCKMYNPFVNKNYNNFFEFYDYAESDLMDILSNITRLLPKIEQFDLKVINLFYYLKGSEDIRIAQIAKKLGKSKSDIEQLISNLTHDLLDLLKKYKMTKTESKNCTAEYKIDFELQLERNKGIRINKIFCVKNHPYILVCSGARVYRCPIAERSVDLVIEDEIVLNLSIYDYDNPMEYISFASDSNELKKFKSLLEMCDGDYQNAFKQFGENSI